jgi:hypothetical protein
MPRPYFLAFPGELGALVVQTPFILIFVKALRNIGSCKRRMTHG